MNHIKLFLFFLKKNKKKIFTHCVVLVGGGAAGRESVFFSGQFFFWMDADFLSPFAGSGFGPNLDSLFETDDPYLKIEPLYPNQVLQLEETSIIEKTTICSDGPPPRNVRTMALKRKANDARDARKAKQTLVSCLQEEVRRLHERISSGVTMQSAGLSARSQSLQLYSMPSSTMESLRSQLLTFEKLSNLHLFLDWFGSFPPRHPIYIGKNSLFHTVIIRDILQGDTCTGKTILYILHSDKRNSMLSHASFLLIMHTLSDHQFERLQGWVDLYGDSCRSSHSKN